MLGLLSFLSQRLRAGNCGLALFDGSSGRREAEIAHWGAVVAVTGDRAAQALVL